MVKAMTDHDDYMAAVSDYDAESRRDDYRQRCRHYMPDVEGCRKSNRPYEIRGGILYINCDCDGKCPRMRRYDKKLKGGKK
jgi:hypothetical protein